MISAVMFSMTAMSIPHSQMKSVKRIAMIGSPLESVCLNRDRNGITSSLAIACSKRGAPVNDCIPAPTVDRKQPIYNIVGTMVTKE